MELKQGNSYPEMFGVSEQRHDEFVEQIVTPHLETAKTISTIEEGAKFAPELVRKACCFAKTPEEAAYFCFTIGTTDENIRDLSSNCLLQNMEKQGMSKLDLLTGILKRLEEETN